MVVDDKGETTWSTMKRQGYLSTTSESHERKEEEWKKVVERKQSVDEIRRWGCDDDEDGNDDDDVIGIRETRRERDCQCKDRIKVNTRREKVNFSLFWWCRIDVMMEKKVSFSSETQKTKWEKSKLIHAPSLSSSGSWFCLLCLIWFSSLTSRVLSQLFSCFLLISFRFVSFHSLSRQNHSRWEQIAWSIQVVQPVQLTRKQTNYQVISITHHKFVIQSRLESTQTESTDSMSDGKRMREID